MVSPVEMMSDGATTEFQVNVRGDVLRIEPQLFAGSDVDFANIRIWYEGQGGTFKPTRKGICIKASSLDKLIAGLQKLDTAHAEG